MHCTRALLLLSLLASVTACNDSEPALPVQAKPELLTRFEFAVEGVRYAISLPEQAVMQPHGPQGVIFYARRNQRLQRTMIFSPASRGGDGSFDQEHFARDKRGRIARDRKDRAIRYLELGQTGAGSGGAIEEIAGNIEIGANRLFFECSDQSEGPARARWCLDYINSLERLLQNSPDKG